METEKRYTLDELKAREKQLRGECERLRARITKERNPAKRAKLESELADLQREHFQAERGIEMIHFLDAPGPSADADFYDRQYIW